MAHLKTSLLLGMLSLVALCGMAQEGQPVRTFYDTRVVNGHSTELVDEGSMKFIIAHRFGRINTGAYDLFGLDNATMRMGLDYGVTKWLNIGIGRSSFEKTVDGYLKARLLRQMEGDNSKPVSVVYFAGIAANGLRFQDPERNDDFSSRLAYTHQLLVSRRFGDRLSAQVMPTLVHRNLVLDSTFNNDVFAVGVAGRYVLSKRVTLSAEYFYALPDQIPETFNNTLSVGIELETKAHVFQFHLSNSRGMTEKFFVSETTGQWSAGDIHLGFNITRDFKVKGRKY